MIERLILTTKQMLRLLPLIPLRRESLRRELVAIFGWYNEHRPHTGLAGKTPNEVYRVLRPANRRPRLEPRKRWPRASLCANPHALVAGQPGDHFNLEVSYHGRRRHLPIVSLRRAA